MNAISKIQKKPLGAVRNVKELLYNAQARSQLEQVAASHMNPERMMRLMANAVRTTPKLAECDPMSLLGGLMTCASLGLEPNTVMGHAYLIPFQNRRKGITEVQLVLGYKGLIDLARRSGHITSIAANIHYSDDELWDYEEGTEARLRHIPGPQEGEKLHAYAIAKFKDGGHAYAVLPWAKVMSVRDGSQGWQTAVKYNNTKTLPWHLHEDAMACKTAIRALAKMLPLSVEMRDAISLDGQKANFRGFALDPATAPEVDDDDLTIDGEAVEEEAAPETEEQPEAPKEEKPAEKQPEEAPDAHESEENALTARIIEELSEQVGDDDVEATLELWRDQIVMLSEADQKRISDAADEARAKGEAE